MGLLGVPTAQPPATEQTCHKVKPSNSDPRRYPTLRPLSGGGRTSELPGGFLILKPTCASGAIHLLGCWEAAPGDGTTRGPPQWGRLIGPRLFLKVGTSACPPGAISQAEFRMLKWGGHGNGFCSQLSRGYLGTVSLLNKLFTVCHFGGGGRNNA